MDSIPTAAELERRAQELQAVYDEYSARLQELSTEYRNRIREIVQAAEQQKISEMRARIQRL